MNTLGWALFLAVSWTWCIGMYLPSLLVRDGGVPFFLAFLVPNVIGAASVGWVLGRRGGSQRFVAGFRPILVAFSIVTIAFHAYFLVWRAGERVAGGDPNVLIGVVLGASLVLNAVAARKRVGPLAALIAFFFSLCLGGLLVAVPPPTPVNVLGLELAGLSMVTLLGFGLCPYLDVTFNLACQQARNPRAAFTIGFLVLFTLTILVATRGRVLWTPPSPPYEVPGRWLALAIGLHFGAQAAFTVAAHAAALRLTSYRGVVGEPTDAPMSAHRSTTWPLLAGGVLALLLFFGPMSVNVGGEGLMPTHELGYRFFLAAYGLVFPAWMLLSLGGRDPLSRRTLTVLALACLLAAPFYWIGMVQREEAWLIPGVAIVLVSRLAAEPRKDHSTTQAQLPGSITKGS